jgi:two-component system alkaline phosphatase synthesis response regulator PhoP
MWGRVLCPPGVELWMPDKKVLVAEDDSDIRYLITYSLKYVGYEVVEVTNGRDAVTRAEQEQPDLILLDVRMPKLDGLEACVLLRTNAATREIPVVFLSARGQDAEVKRGLALGAEEYVVKPFAPEELLRRVEGVLQRADRQRGQPILATGQSLHSSDTPGANTEPADECCCC